MIKPLPSPNVWFLSLHAPTRPKPATRAQDQSMDQPSTLKIAPIPGWLITMAMKQYCKVTHLSGTHFHTFDLKLVRTNLLLYFPGPHLKQNDVEIRGSQSKRKFHTIFNPRSQVNRPIAYYTLEPIKRPSRPIPPECSHRVWSRHGRVLVCYMTSLRKWSTTLDSHLTTYIPQAVNYGQCLFIIFRFFLK